MTMKKQKAYLKPTETLMTADSDELISMHILKDKDIGLRKTNDQSCRSHQPSHYPQGAEECTLITKEVEIVMIIRGIVDDTRRGSCCIGMISFSWGSHFGHTYVHKEGR
jgi:hypothetical protein